MGFKAEKRSDNHEYGAFKSNRRMGFLKDARRLNVAITRAKRGLIIIGNPVTLSHDHNWKGMLDWIEERNLMAWHMVHT